ncbi:hypothetical protein [Streptomyces sp. NPDC006691]|uniref:hypothetical protein n=1 Tax=Streptomyces sp. NPDC006691 TaxID=3364757 RepID=UPI00369CA491
MASAALVGATTAGVVVATTGGSGGPLPPAGCEVLNQRGDSEQFTAAASRATDPELKSALKSAAADKQRVEVDNQLRDYAEQRQGTDPRRRDTTGVKDPAATQRANDAAAYMRDRGTLAEICEG